MVTVIDVMGELVNKSRDISIFLALLRDLPHRSNSNHNIKFMQYQRHHTHVNNYDRTCAVIGVS